MDNKLLLITWKDCTHFDDSPMTADEISEEPLLEMQDIGFLIHEDKEKVAIAMERYDIRFRHITWIPKSLIVSRKVLK